MKNYSQNNEQQIILNYLESNNINEGKVLEIGAFDGENFSNVKALLLNNAWRATMVDASPFCFVKLYEMYKEEENRIDLINSFVCLEQDLNTTNLVEFYESPLSAVSSSSLQHTQRFQSIIPEKIRKTYMSKVGLKEILNKFGPFEVISIDIEGFSAELSLQEWFNPLEYNCKLICIEHDSRYKELTQRFGSFGYKRIGMNPENIIFAI
jgi:FkbM family methyltransferase